MKIKITSIILLSSLAFANEVSVFGAGDLNTDKPYGLNKTEKYILKNKNDLGKIDTKFKGVKTTLESLSQRIDGIESIYEGDSKKLNDTVLNVNKIIKKLEEAENISTKNTTDIENLKKVTSQLLTMQEDIQKENKKNLDTLKNAIDKLANEVNEINKKYVSVSELKSNMKQFVTLDEFNAFKKSLGQKTNVKIKSSAKTKKLSFADKKRCWMKQNNCLKKIILQKQFQCLNS